MRLTGESQGRIATAKSHLAPLSIDAARAVSVDRPTLLVFFELTAHADPRGMCWPGIQRLAANTHYSIPAVQRALGRLGELDYVRFHVTVDPLRNKKQTTYQVSPYVMYVREELEAEAVTLWESAKRLISSVAKHIEPESEPAIQNQNQNQIENQQRTRKGSTRLDTGAKAPTAPSNGANSAQAHNSATAPQTTPQGAHSANALTNDIPLAAPALAAWLAANFGTRESQAAALIDRHGVPKVFAGVQAVQAMPNVRKPYGKLVSLLEPKDLTPIEKALKERSRNRG